jgi:hypothetical protein
MALPQFDITLSVLADAAATLDFDGGRGLGRELVLATHGLVIQGTMIGPGAYFRALGRPASPTHEKLGDADAAQFHLFEEMTRRGQAQHISTRGLAASPNGEPLSQVQTEEAYAAFIHLQHVTIMNGGVGIHVPLWRARLTEITGWTFGSIDPE